MEGADVDQSKFHVLSGEEVEGADVAQSKFHV